MRKRLDYALIKKLYKEGMSVREISRLQNTAATTVNSILRKDGLLNKKQTKLTQMQKTKERIRNEIAKLQNRLEAIENEEKEL